MSKNNNIIQSTELRPTVEVILQNTGIVLTGPRGTAIGEFLKHLKEWKDPSIMGAVVNNELRELTYPIEMDARVIPVTMADSDGARIYRRSVTFLLEAAFKDCFPGALLTVDHSVSSGGFYCQVENHTPLTQNDLVNLEEHMRVLVDQDLDFERTNVSLVDAIQRFQEQGQFDKVRLLKYRQKEYLVLYRLLDHYDYHHGYMVPSTGYLKWFALIPFGEGFVIQFPRKHAPSELLPMPEYPKLLATFRQYGHWLTRLGIESVGALNDAICEDRAKELVLISEALQGQHISEIAAQVVNKISQTKIILIAGPSSSGKTTFSKRLAVQLLAHGLSPFALEMDNYFVDRDLTPKDENGEFDYEHLNALNLKRLGNDLQQLVTGQEVQLPHYNFKEGMSEEGDIVQLHQDQIIILEGIHGLNPALLPNISSEQTFKIYVSCLTQLNLDRHNRISTTDTRLLRRVARDATSRGYNAFQTIQRWESVRRGEKTHIFPYQENADVFFNSALVFELSALKNFVEPLLRQVPYGTLEYIEAKRLLALLEWFLPIDTELIPDNSILREFIGGSILKDFKLWKNESGNGF
ncbi:MAG TPA: nucleoside kinase [Longilinea sp.]|nr:nucleoside kinase [Longilinea sp.]